MYAYGRNIFEEKDNSVQFVKRRNRLLGNLGPYGRLEDRLDNLLGLALDRLELVEHIVHKQLGKLDETLRVALKRTLRNELLVRIHGRLSRHAGRFEQSSPKLIESFQVR